MTLPIDETQRKAARAVGFTYLFALVAGVFAEFYVRYTLVVSDNAAQTAQNILAHEWLFRLGVVANLSTFAADVVLITALYVVLRPVPWPPPAGQQRPPVRSRVGARSARCQVWGTLTIVVALVVVGA